MKEIEKFKPYTTKEEIKVKKGISIFVIKTPHEAKDYSISGVIRLDANSLRIIFKKGEDCLISDSKIYGICNQNGHIIKVKRMEKEIHIYFEVEDVENIEIEQ